MDWKGHLFAGFLACPATIFALNQAGFATPPETILAGFLISAVFSLLPDIDVESSKIHGAAFIALLIASIASLAVYSFSGSPVFLAGFLLFLVPGVAMKFMRHRGFCHTIRFGLACALPLAVAGPVYPAFAFVAFFSHLAVDLEIRL